MNEEKEEWRLIARWPTHEVSNLGRVRSLYFRWGRDGAVHQKPRNEPRILVQIQNPDTGYLAVSIAGEKRYTHSLVCEAFNGPRPGAVGWECAHEDGVRTNNVPSNLKWKTWVGNNADKKRHGTHLFGEIHPTAKLTEEQVNIILSAGISATSLAEKFGVHPATIRAIRRKVTWKHVK